jgi:hypothetical protein
MRCSDVSERCFQNRSGELMAMMMGYKQPTWSQGVLIEGCPDGLSQKSTYSIKLQILVQ